MSEGQTFNHTGSKIEEFYCSLSVRHHYLWVIMGIAPEGLGSFRVEACEGLGSFRVEAREGLV